MSVAGQQGSVGTHLHHITVALHACEEDGLGKGVFHVVATRGILAQIDCGALALVVVVEVLVVDKPPRVVVVVLINDGDLVLLGNLPTPFIIRTLKERTYGTHNGDVGIFGLHSFAEVEIALGKHIADKILVADAYIFEVERFGMTRVGSHLSPFRGLGVTVGPFHEVEDILQEFIHLVHRHAALLTVATER